MKSVRIGVYDEEWEYVNLLCGYLQNFGRGKWIVSGYTDEQVVYRMGNQGRMDVFLSTDKDVIEGMKLQQQDVLVIYLTSGKEESLEDSYASVYRFQSARTVGNAIYKLIANKKKGLKKQYIMMYSPVGRCGKTTLAKEITRNQKYGRWLYAGMEDYSSGDTFSDTGEVLYYIKERKADKVMTCIEQCNDFLIVAQGAYELKNLEPEDMEWLKEVFEETNYMGIIFDMGTAIAQTMDILALSDYIFVPVLKGDYSHGKIESFKRNLHLYGLEHMKEQIVYLEMEDMKKVEQMVESILVSQMEVYEKDSR